MSDPTYLPSWTQDIYLIEVGIPGPAGTGFTAVEATQVRTDLDTLLARPNISTLESLTNVPDTVAATGQSLIKTATDWAFGNPNGSLTYVVDSWSGEPQVANATIITAGPGIKVTQEAAGSGVRAHMAMQFAGTGSATTAAKSDHSHAAVIQQMQILPYQGVLSTGYRTLSSAGITGLLATETYDITLTVVFDVIAAGVDSVITPRASLGTGSLDGYDVKFKGYGKNVTIMQYATGVTGVTSFPMLVRVFYNSGPQVEIGAGEILAIAKPRR